MPESINHMQYVSALLSFVKEIVPDSQEALIYIDTPDSTCKPPKTTMGYIPDLFFCCQGLMVIGEAKTAGDVDKRHSCDQYKDYYNDAVNYNGRAVVVLAVPWHSTNTVKNIMRRIKKEHSKLVDVYVISEMGAEKI